MSKLFTRIVGYIRNWSLMGMDKAGNQYFVRTEEIDGIMKEKRWVVFKGEKDPTSIPVEWVCWLNGQRKSAPTAEEMMELEARREQVRLNVALLKKEEEEKRAKAGATCKTISTGQVGGPDLKSFIRQFPTASEVIKDPVVGFCYYDLNHLCKLSFYQSLRLPFLSVIGSLEHKTDFRISEGDKVEEASDAMDGMSNSKERAAEKEKPEPQSSEPIGSGQSFRPGTWQPPT
uniref:NADH dehydrogenase [ubiquinone] 1 alpha subcomplex subunit 12 n=1 Tax=Quercus lobata TaxID=97700 RepID=A0A7N2M972_QUELO